MAPDTLTFNADRSLLNPHFESYKVSSSPLRRPLFTDSSRPNSSRPKATPLERFIRRYRSSTRRLQAVKRCNGAGGKRGQGRDGTTSPLGRADSSCGSMQKDRSGRHPRR